jgi:hypothetical protein
LVNRAIVYSRARYLVVALAGLNLRWTNRKLGSRTGSGIASETPAALNTLHDRPRQAQPPGWGFIADATVLLHHVRGNDPPAILEHNRIGQRVKRHEAQPHGG